MYTLPINTILNIDALPGLKQLPDKCVDCCVTSPPYWGLRDYDIPVTNWPELQYKIFGFEVTIPPWSGQLGLEPTPEMFVGHIVLLFREVYRVMKDCATLWLNMGDSYAAGGRGFSWGLQSFKQDMGWRPAPAGYKRKDLVGIPWMVAFALRADGWYLRQDIIWNKPNPMPESVTDRCTKSHEYIFLLSKSKKYYFDAEAIKTPSIDPNTKYAWGRAIDGSLTDVRKGNGQEIRKRKHQDKNMGGGGDGFKGHSGNYDSEGNLIGNGLANKRSVWTVSTESFADAHFATYPQSLITDCIKAGTSDEGCCAECGKPYERIIDKKLVPTHKASYNSAPDQRDFDADKNDQGSNRAKDGHKPGWIYESQTVGWKPTCTCNAAKTPSIVLDFFMGSGTTAIVARKLGRNFIGFEINKEYMNIQNRRMLKELGMFQ